jgi:hypothetical protein
MFTTKSAPMAQSEHCKYFCFNKANLTLWFDGIQILVQGRGKTTSGRTESPTRFFPEVLTRHRQGVIPGVF